MPPRQGEPLRRYFHGLYSQAELNAFEANMYLAEDRVLCLEIVAKKGSAYRCEAK
jgi:chitin synthase